MQRSPPPPPPDGSPDSSRCPHLGAQDEGSEGGWPSDSLKQSDSPSLCCSAESLGLGHAEAQDALYKDPHRLDVHPRLIAVGAAASTRLGAGHANEKKIEQPQVLTECAHTQTQTCYEVKSLLRPPLLSSPRGPLRLEQQRRQTRRPGCHSAFGRLGYWGFRVLGFRRA